MTNHAFESAEITGFYDARYANDAYGLAAISHKESTLIQGLIKESQHIRSMIAVDERRIILIDYGCGDGRLNTVYEKAALFLEQEGFCLQVFAIDPSRAGLDVYGQRLRDNSYDIVSENVIVIGQGEIHYRRSTLTVTLVAGDQQLLKVLTLLIRRADVLVAAGVLCHLLGSNRRVELLLEFRSAAFSLFMSLPTKGDFSSVQAKFENLREERDLLNEAIKVRPPRDKQTMELVARLQKIQNELGDAKESGEIYYRAGRVRNTAEKLPSYRDALIPYFATYPAEMSAALKDIGYIHVASASTPFANHQRWIASLASNLFPVSPLLVDTGQSNDV
jgi:hypothetical protein